MITVLTVLATGLALQVFVKYSRLLSRIDQIHARLARCIDLDSDSSSDEEDLLPALVHD